MECMLNHDYLVETNYASQWIYIPEYLNSYRQCGGVSHSGNTRDGVLFVLTLNVVCRN